MSNKDKIVDAKNKLEEKNKTKNGCVSFIHDKKHKIYYYGINSKNEENLKEAIEILLNNKETKSRPIHCTEENSYSNIITISYFEYNNIYKKLEGDIYDCIDKNGKIKVAFPLSEFRKQSPLEDNRNFSCAEKKVINYLLENGLYGLLNKPQYTTKRPCYYCLPSIKNVIYLDDAYNVKKIYSFNIPGSQSFYFTRSIKK